MKKFMLSVLIVAGGLLISAYASAQTIPLEDAVVRVSESAGRAVVSIGTEKTSRLVFSGPQGANQDEFLRQFFEDFFGHDPQFEQKKSGLGSGVIIDADGHILTNAHVIADADKIKVTLPDGRQFDGRITGQDERSDLAIVKIEGAKKLPVAALGDSGNLKIGQWVLAIGNPFGFALRNHEPTVTVGVVSALHRALGVGPSRKAEFNDLIQTDAAINPGNSGGPLVNLKGEVVGINVAIFSMSGGYQGVGFATPINVAKRLIDRLKRGEKILYGWLGVIVQDMNPEVAGALNYPGTRGVAVRGTMKQGPADKGGIQPDDVILYINGKETLNSLALTNIVDQIEVGKTVPVVLWRKGKDMTLQVKIEARP